MDVGTGLAALGTAQVTKDMLGRMLGPTADYLGEGFRDWTERGLSNVRTVFANGAERLGDRLDTPGGVPPRVLQAVLEQAQFAEDEVAREYLGGVLASSRSEDSRDDRAATHARLIGDLSTYALRTHYLLYTALRAIEDGRNVDAWNLGDTARQRFYVATTDYLLGMDFNEAESEFGRINGILADTFLNLGRFNLLGTWAIGTPQSLRSAVLNLAFPKPGLVFSPSREGALLYCSAQGVRDDPLGAFANPALRTFETRDIIVPHAIQLSALPT